MALLARVAADWVAVRITARRGDPAAARPWRRGVSAVVLLVLGAGLAAQGAEFENFISRYGSGAKSFEIFGIANGAVPHLQLYDRRGTLRKTFPPGDEESTDPQQLDQAADALAKGLAKVQDANLKEKLQYKLGDMRFRQGNYAEAAKVLLAQISEFAQGELAGPARYLAAESLLRQEDYKQALPLFEKVSADKAYRNAIRNSDRQNARIEHDKALGRAVLELLSDDTELYKQYSDNPSFKKWLADSVFALTYGEAGSPGG